MAGQRHPCRSGIQRTGFPGLAVPTGDNFNAELKTGYDVDAIVGYDWGWVRTEGEIGFKRAAFDKVAIGEANFFPGEHDADGYIRSFTLMANVLADVPLGGGWNLTAGPGFGWGKLKVHAKVDTDDDGGDTAKLNDENRFRLALAADRRHPQGGHQPRRCRPQVPLHRHRQAQKYDSGFYGDLEEGRLRARSPTCQPGLQLWRSGRAGDRPVARRRGPAAAAAAPRNQNLPRTDGGPGHGRLSAATTAAAARSGTRTRLT